MYIAQEIENSIGEKFCIWIISFYLLNAVLMNYQHGVDAADLINTPGLYKFIAAVKTNAGVCTGTIINKEWILTAAHCLYGVADEDVTIMAGITNWEHPQEEFGQFRTSAEIKLHPRYWNDRLAKFDIALVRVNESFSFNDWVGNIQVAGDAWSVNHENTEQCMSLGFGGFVNNKSPLKSLKIWNVTAAYGPDRCPCTRRYQYRRLVCSRDNDVAQLCKGDDGGPLVCGNVVRGVAHMVRNWYRCSEDPKYPMENCYGSPEKGLSIYILLCPFNDWMHGIVEDIPPSPLTCQTSAMSYSIMYMVVSLFIFHLIRNLM